MFVSGVLYYSLGAVSFDQTVGSYNIVTISGLMLTVVVSGVSVCYLIGKVVLGWGIWVFWRLVCGFVSWGWGVVCWRWRGWGRAILRGGRGGSHEGNEECDLKAKWFKLYSYKVLGNLRKYKWVHAYWNRYLLFIIDFLDIN